MSSSTMITRRVTTAIKHSASRSPCCPAQRSLFNFPSPFGSSSSSKPASPAKGTLTKKGSIWVYKEAKDMPYSQRELYSVIADVDSYQEFLPFAASSSVLSAVKRTSQGQETKSPRDKGWLTGGQAGEHWTMDAELTIGAMGFDQTYVSKVDAKKWESVSASAKDTSVFSHLETTWTLRPVANGSDPATNVDLYLAYSFVSPLHAAAASAMWEKVSGLMIGAFEKRATAVLGRR